MATLNAAFTFEKVNNVSVCICQHLNLNVTRSANVALYENRSVSERTQRFRNGAFHLFFHFFNLFNDTHSFTTSASACFNQNWKSNFQRDTLRLFHICNGVFGSRNHRNVVLSCSRFCCKFITHHFYAIRIRTDEGDSVFLNFSCEVCIFRKESVPWVNAFNA